MFTYKVIEEKKDGGYPIIPPSYIEVEKNLEVELMKEALLKIINSEYFIEMPLSAIMIEWHLRKIFSFDFTLEQKNDIDYIITIPNGIENMKIDFSINNK